MSIGDGIFAAAVIWATLRVVDIVLGAKAVRRVIDMEDRVQEIERKLEKGGIY